MCSELDEAIALAGEACRCQAVAVDRALGNAAEVLPRIVASNFTPDVVTDQTSAHDLRVGYIPSGRVGRGSGAMATRDAAGYETLCSIPWRCTSRRCSRATARCRRLRLRQQHSWPGRVTPRVDRCFQHNRLCPGVCQAAVCRGSGPFRWVALPAILGHRGDQSRDPRAVP